jgi:hypothetical protein
MVESPVATTAYRDTAFCPGHPHLSAYGNLDIVKNVLFENSLSIRIEKKNELIFIMRRELNGFVRIDQSIITYPAP